MRLILVYFEMCNDMCSSCRPARSVLCDVTRFLNKGTINTSFAALAPPISLKTFYVRLCWLLPGPYLGVNRALLIVFELPADVVKHRKLFSSESIHFSHVKYCMFRCHNNWKKRWEFLRQECFEHWPLLRAECTCGAPYNRHPPPNEGEALRRWLKDLNL